MSPVSRSGGPESQGTFPPPACSLAQEEPGDAQLGADNATVRQPIRLISLPLSERHCGAQAGPSVPWQVDACG